jgi:hypothetical protein
MLKAAKYFSLLLAAFFIFTTCKKYPENNLWLKNPYKAFDSGYLTYVTVDGADSTRLISSSINQDVTKDFYATEKDETLYRIYSDTYRGVYEFVSKKKQIKLKISFEGAPENLSPNPKPYTPTAFKYGGAWEILKLTSNGSLKIRKEYNGKVYEAQFN